MPHPLLKALCRLPRRGATNAPTNVPPPMHTAVALAVAVVGRWYQQFH